ncbi:hypothetical protein LX32DRAFT_700045 [Colletotrichum zoysiae]|nr:hypothetical protein LX32DRAFT_700045 [Colletotrichum zoysiae]
MADFTKDLTANFDSQLRELVKSAHQNIEQVSGSAHERIDQVSDSAQKAFQSAVFKIQTKTTEDLQKLSGHPDLRQLDLDAVAYKLGLGPS